MKKILCALGLLCVLTMQAQPRKAARSTDLLGAKHLEVTTGTSTQTEKHYYMVSSNYKLLLKLHEQDVVTIADDVYPRAEVKSMRFKQVPRLILDEDSTVHSKTYSVSNGLLALRRNFRLGRWNTLVLPVNLTGTQVLELFGEDTRLAVLSGSEVGDDISIAFDLVDLNTDDVALQANVCYFIQPTREPDVSKAGTAALTGKRLKGPFYLLPNVTMKAGQSPKMSYVYDESNTQVARFRGTYERLDNTVMRSKTVIANKMLYVNTWSFNDEGYLQENTDSTLIQAFRCWFQNLDETKKLHVYINGVEDDLDGTNTAIAQTIAKPRQMGGDIYDVQGRKVATLRENEDLQSLNLPRGIYIVRGKKYVIQ